jgi:ABC-type transport system involved in multi-copper enzyme maturation permease subunit
LYDLFGTVEKGGAKVGDIFKFEVNRILFDKRSVIFLICLLAVTLYVVNIGISEYNSFKNSKEIFLNYEKEKVDKYLTYDQFGGFGFRVIYEPSPLAVFFNNSSVFGGLETNIDVREIVRVNDVKKGRPLFKTGGHKDFAGIIFLFGSLYFLLMGLVNFKSDRLVKFAITRKYIPISALFRLVLLVLAFAVIFLASFILVLLRGLSFSASEIGAYLLFYLYTLAFLVFFYCLGLLLSAMFRSNKILTALIVWFSFIFIIPEIGKVSIISDSQAIPLNETLNLKKFETLMNAEKQFHKDALAEQNFNEDPKKVWTPLAVRFWRDV